MQEPSTPTHFPAPRTLVVMALFFEGGLGVVAVLLGAWWDCPPAAAVRFNSADAVRGLAASLPMLALFFVCLRLPFRPLVELRRTVDSLLVPLFRHCQLAELAVISLLAGVGEEMLFRGVLQEAISRFYGAPMGPWIGLAAASILFGLVHAVSATYTVLAGLTGLYLGGIWMASGNLLVPIVAHAAYDFFVLTYLVRIRGRPAQTEGPGGPEELP